MSEPNTPRSATDNRFGEVLTLTRLPDKQLLQAKLHEFYALNAAQGEAQ
ncbi:hypothetical protein [Pseudomonas sp. 910_23]